MSGQEFDLDCVQCGDSAGEHGKYLAIGTPAEVGPLCGCCYNTIIDCAESRAKDAEIASLRAQLAACKSDLATACTLASKSAEQAQAFGAALEEAQKVPAGYWEDKQ